MQPGEIIDVLKEVVLYDKSGHRKRFVSAIEILSSKTKHGVYRIKTRQASILHQCRVFPTNMLQLVSIYILTCFAWRILIKTKIILEKL